MIEDSFGHLPSEKKQSREYNAMHYQALKFDSKTNMDSCTLCFVYLFFYFISNSKDNDKNVYKLFSSDSELKTHISFSVQILN